MFRKLKKALASSGSSSSLIPAAQLEDVQNKFLLHKVSSDKLYSLTKYT